MYAIIETGGKQYIVREKDKIEVEKIKGEVNSSIVFDKVLMAKSNGNAVFGKPTLQNAKVIGKILEHKKTKKIIVFKYKKRKGYKKTKGHRQNITKVLIEKIEVSSK